MNKKIDSIEVVEDNAGGIHFHCFDVDNYLILVLTNLQYIENSTPLDDIFDVYYDNVDYKESSEWYDLEGNFQNEENENGELLTCEDVYNDNESTKTIAEFDGKKLEIYVDNMGNAGKKYFHVVGY